MKEADEDLKSLLGPKAIAVRDDRIPRPVAEMLGDFFREAAVLVFVFGLLEPALRPGKPTFSWIIGVVLLSTVSLLLGISMERKR